MIGPIDHGFCQSIYFFDPNGHRLEMTLRTESDGALERFAVDAPATLANWEARKRAGAFTAPAPA